jgi:hypothetical protein
MHQREFYQGPEWNKKIIEKLERKTKILVIPRPGPWWEAQSDGDGKGVFVTTPYVK